MDTNLSEERIKHYAELLDLPQETAEMLKSGEISFQRISDLKREIGIPALIERISPIDKLLWNWDYNGEDRNEVAVEFNYILSPEKLDSDGLLVQHDGKDIGYCLLFYVPNVQRNNAPNIFHKIEENINWPALTGFLNQITDNDISEERAWYVHDYGISDKELRGKGMGRLLMRHTLDEVVPEKDVAIGFIDSGNIGSILSGTRAGRVIAKEVPSPYKGLPYHVGQENTFVSFTFNGIKPTYTGNEVLYGSKDEIPQKLREVVGVGSTESLEALTNGKISMVGYNPASKRLEEVRFR